MGRIYNLLCNAQDGGEDAEYAKEQLFKVLRHTALYYLRRYEYSFFQDEDKEGADQVSPSIPEDAIDDEVIRLQHKIISRWNRENCNSSDAECWKYINTWMKGDLRKFYCRQNGFSPYYMEYVESMRKAGLHLWKTDETDLIAFIEGLPRRPKDAKRLLSKLRYFFPNPRSDAPRRNVLSVYDLVRKVSDGLEVSAATAKYLLALEMNGLDIWRSKEGDLIKFFSDYSVKPDRMLEKMRRNLAGKDVGNFLWKLHNEYLFPEAITLPKVADRPATKKKT